MIRIERISQIDGQFEFRDPSRSLVVRGAHPEWVLLAAAEVIGNSLRLEAESLIEELAVMHALGAVDHAELTAARIEHRHRFDSSPRCRVSLGTVDYYWSSQAGPNLQQEATVDMPLKLGPEMLVAQPSGSA